MTGAWLACQASVWLQQSQHLMSSRAAAQGAQLANTMTSLWRPAMSVTSWSTSMTQAATRAPGEPVCAACCITAVRSHVCLVTCVLAALCVECTLLLLGTSKRRPA